jgi:hypothetical protein
MEAPFKPSKGSHFSAKDFELNELDQKGMTPLQQ